MNVLVVNFLLTVKLAKLNFLWICIPHKSPHTYSPFAHVPGALYLSLVVTFQLPPVPSRSH